MKGIKIVTIGGGSSYTPELVEGFIKRYEELPVRELWLVDIPEGEEKLNIVGNLAKRMVKSRGPDGDPSDLGPKGSASGCRFRHDPVACGIAGCAGVG